MKRIALLALLVAAPMMTPANAQDTTGRGGRGAGRGAGGGGGWNGAMDSSRTRQLYVSKTPSDIRGCAPAKRGYVVVTPDYRGSTGHGDEWMRRIDYGGKEVDDVLSAVDYLATLPYVDSKKLGIMGWSHGGFITSHILFRKDNPFRSGAAIVPVTNLVFRLSDHSGLAVREELRAQPRPRLHRHLSRSLTGLSR
jgi:hypothetical protein